ncbi:hypothetical protein M0804_008060 [Polistes exclamans]|nr:hypothetical protein M0804_008060 [Polistes exclamans]
MDHVHEHLKACDDTGFCRERDSHKRGPIIQHGERNEWPAFTYEDVISKTYGLSKSSNYGHWNIVEREKNKNAVTLGGMRNEFSTCSKMSLTMREQRLLNRHPVAATQKPALAEKTRAHLHTFPLAKSKEEEEEQEEEQEEE